MTKWVRAGAESDRDFGDGGAHRRDGHWQEPDCLSYPLSGPRQEKLFIAQNCGALPEVLLESELFGHKRGSFTGAISDKKGLFEVADGGTLFLDEVSEMSPAMQVKLLQVVQEGRFRRVGDSVYRQVDVRILAATNKDLEAEVKKGRFRADLYYRLNVFPIRIPPLRERMEDIPLFAKRCLSKQGKKLRSSIGRTSVFPTGQFHRQGNQPHLFE